MKNVLLTVSLILLGVIAFAQNNTVQVVKYITEAPDGSIAMTIYDDSRENNLKLESANNFYKYEILDLKSSEAVYTSKNRGKECIIDKTQLADGTYNLRLYTSNFVITSKITIVTSHKMDLAFKSSNAIAAND